MELLDNIAEKEGEFVSFGQILKTACLLVKQQNKKTLTAREIQFAVRIHFTEEKLKSAITSGTKNITVFTCQEDDGREDEDFKKTHKSIKRMIQKFEVTKVSKGVIPYSMGIFKDISSYEMEEYEYEKEIDIRNFLRCATLIVEIQRMRMIKEKHFDEVKEILCPNEEMNLVWSIDKTKESVEKFIDEYLTCKITKDFMKKIIYN